MSEFFSWANRSAGTKSDTVHDDTVSEAGSEAQLSETGSTSSTGKMYEVDLNADSGSTQEDDNVVDASAGQNENTMEAPDQASGVHQLLLSWGLAPSQSPPKEEGGIEKDEPSKRDRKMKDNELNKSWGSSVGVHSLLSSWGSPDSSPQPSPILGSRDVKHGAGVAASIKSSGSEASSAAASEVSDDSPPSSNATTPRCSPATSWRSLDKIILWGTSPADAPLVPPPVEGPKEEIR